MVAELRLQIVFARVEGKRVDSIAGISNFRSRNCSYRFAVTNVIRDEIWNCVETVFFESELN